MDVSVRECPFCGEPGEERETRGWFACSNNSCPAWHLQAELSDWNNRTGSGDERSSFETTFPPPSYVIWCPKFQTYYTREPGRFAHGQTALYTARWDGWRERARLSND